MNNNSNWIKAVAGVFFWRGPSTKDSFCLADLLDHIVPKHMKNRNFYEVPRFMLRFVTFDACQKKSTGIHRKVFFSWI